jgi:tRNA dimethylallyltransferase
LQGIGREAASSGKATAAEGNRRSLEADGVFVFRDREDLYQRINDRVEAMLRNGAIEEVRDAGEISRTAGQMIGVRDIRKYLTGEVSLAECTSRIQQATRRYAKRQLTWFRNQSNFKQLNLSLLKHNEAVEWICAAALAGRTGND